MGIAPGVVQPPVMASFVVPRDRLAGLVTPDGAKPPQFVLVTAPAGSGKTTLLAEMAARINVQGDVVAWLPATPNDGEDGHLPARVLDALADGVRIREPATAARLAALRVPPHPLDPGFVAEAALPLQDVGAPIWLLIDDCHHLLGSPIAMAWIDHYAATAGPGLHVVLAGRRDLGRDLNKQLLDGSAVHLSGADLAFTVPEAARVLFGHGLRLGDGDIHELHQRTEGWAAGLRLAALTLAKTADPAPQLAALAGSTRQIGAYLLAEMLHGLPRASHDFLRSTAAPRLLTVDLAALLTGREDSGAVLEQLLSEGLLITRQDGEHPTYRYHALLRNHLLEEAAALDLARYRWQRRVTAQHADDRGHPEEALEHASAGQAWDLLVDLVNRHGLAMILRGDGSAVARALVALPNRLRTDRLVLLAAELALRRGDVVGAQQHLAHLPGPSSRPTDGDTEVLRTAVHLHSSIMSGRPGPGFRHLVESSDVVLSSPETMLLTSLRAMALIEVDERARATAELRRTQLFATTHGYDALALDCLSHLILIAVGDSHYAHSVDLAEEAVDFATARGWQVTAPMAAIYLSAAGSGFAMLDLAVVDRHLRSGRALSGTAEPKLGAFAALLPVYLDHVTRRSPGTFAVDLKKIWNGIDEQVIRLAGVTTLCLIEIGLALDYQDFALAKIVVDRAQRRLGGRGDLHVIRAALPLLRQQPAQALDLLDELASSGLTTTTRGQVAAATLRVLAASALGREAEAHQALLTAVDLAAEHDLVQPLAVAPSSFLELLQTTGGRVGVDDGFVRRVLAAARARSAHQDAGIGPIRARLTRSEDMILRELASLATLREIADRLRVSENTVKSHVKAIYEKFGVHNRRDAVELGRKRA